MYKKIFILFVALIFVCVSLVEANYPLWYNLPEDDVIKTIRESKGNLSREKVIELIKQLIEKRNNDAFLEATINNDLKEVKRLIKLGVDLDYMKTWDVRDSRVCMMLLHLGDPYFMTALEIAIENKYYEIARELLRSGAKTNNNDIAKVPGMKIDELKALGVDFNGNFLATAVENDNEALVKDLINYGVNVNFGCGAEWEYYTLDKAINKRNDNIISLLKNAGAGKNNELGYIPSQQELNDSLVEALDFGDFEKAKLLILAGANVKAKDYCNHESLIKKSLKSGNVSFAQELIKLGAPVHADDAAWYYYFANNNDLLNVSESENWGGIKYFGNKNKDISLVFDSGFLMELIKNGADINATAPSGRLTALDKGKTGRTTQGFTFISEALENDDFEAMNLAIELGADLNKLYFRSNDSCFLEYQTLLSQAVYTFDKGCSIEGIKYLLEAGADPTIETNNYNMKSRKDGAFIDYLSYCDDLSLISEFMNYGVKLNERDEDGNPVVIRFFKSTYFPSYEDSHSRAVPELIKNGANIDLADETGFTLLMQAAKEGDRYIVELLLRFGAKVNLRDRDNGTALMEAAYHGKYNSRDIVKMLLEYGADKEVKDKRGYTALDYAKMKNHSEIIELLK